ncbi:MAG: hypothetical protein ACRDTQ_02080 [Micromonosporaceae bacterium]
MELLRLALRYIHLLGFALLFGGFAAQYFASKFRINSSMLWGALLQLLTGVLLSAPWPGVEHVYPKIGVKLVLAVLIAVMVIVPRKRKQVAKGHFIAIGAMTLLNVAVAVFWR